MKLTHRIVTSQYEQLTTFYEAVLNVPCRHIGTNYIGQFEVGGCQIEIMASGAQEELTPGAVTPSSNKSIILGIEVESFEVEYQRLKPLVADWVTDTINEPGGVRSIYFRDPDANLVQLFEAS